MDIENITATLNNKESFANFLKELHRNFKEEGGEWENITLDNFLEALSAYASDAPDSSLSWENIANMLLAARVYE